MLCFGRTRLIPVPAEDGEILEPFWGDPRLYCRMLSAVDVKNKDRFSSNLGAFYFIDDEHANTGCRNGNRRKTEMSASWLCSGALDSVSVLDVRSLRGS